MGLYARELCDACGAFCKDIALNCPQCVVNVCAGCEKVFGEQIGFALHLAEEKNLLLLERLKTHGHDAQPEDAMFYEFNRFHNTERYRLMLAEQVGELEERFEKATSEARKLECQLDVKKAELLCAFGRCAKKK